MAPIAILPADVAEGIAAGEVVERPESAVKELIENALDAGATAVQVEVEGGGLRLVRVSDNGCGLSRAEAPLALQRFSTSKIRTLADLAGLRTLGFRGEALAALAAVAQITLLARTAMEVEGTRVSAGGGQVAVDPAASPVGCSVAVANLFYNTPARRKFLKSPMRENELCQQTVQRYAVAYPQVAFKLTIDGRERLVAPPASPRERLALAVGRDAAGEMLPIAWEAGDLRVSGLISSPAIGKSRREGQHFFVNRRPIRSGLLAVMLERPYAGRLPPGRYPLAAIQIEMDPALVDVNVHPRKAEVRFAQERAVYAAVSQAVSAALAPFPVLETWGTPDWPFPEVPSADHLLAEGRIDYELDRRVEVLGQVSNTYVVARSRDGLVIVDQHAAHEAILAQKLLAHDEAQPLPAAVRVDVTAREGELLAAHLGLFADLGFQIEPFGRSSFLVRALPRALAGQAVPWLLAELLEELAAGQTLEPDPLREKIAARAACRAAVKAGDVLLPAEQQGLLDELLAAWSPSTCPHGRPALFTLGIEEMERRFLRRAAGEPS